MKVTIDFNGTKIVVPCGDGDISVRELTNLATVRYKKAIGKPLGFHVSVLSLKSYEGGILDPDGCVADVCDDREQLQALFDEHLYGGHYGDGAADVFSTVDPIGSRDGSPPVWSEDQGSTTTLVSQTDYGMLRPSQPFFSKPYTSEYAVPRNIPVYKPNNDDEFDSLGTDSANFQSKCSLNVLRRREPLGASGNKPADRPKSPKGEQECIEITIPNEIGPLGIHVVPCPGDGRLQVAGIEPGGRIDRNGRLAVNDEITEINGYPLINVEFNKAQEIFKEALSAKELRLRVLKRGNAETGDNKENEDGNRAGAAKSEQSLQPGTKITSAVHANNTRKIGTVLHVYLKKGPSGLGFKITTRDNAPAGGVAPVYIKNILPKGAAIEEGTLKPGDRLLEVNDVDVDGMSQSEVVQLLRAAPTDKSIHLVVSRHMSGASEGERAPPSPLPPPATSSSNEETSLEEYQFPWKQGEVLTFDIPVHDTERAGLGVSVKGKTSTRQSGIVDLGIFVKTVITGGAASKDGRLQTNDQLLNINGISLLAKPNPEAMETLRKAMHEEGPVPGVISLTIARRKEEEQQRMRDSMSSIVTSSSDDAIREYNVSGPPPPPPPNEFRIPDHLSVRHSRNPVVDRLMGKQQSSADAGLRNESYYRATHDTWNATMLQQHMTHMTPPPHPPTVHPQREQLMIEQDNDTPTESESPRNESLSSLLDVAPAFSRDQPGRQSMSEKRHATLDAKNTDTYQKRKKIREEKEKQQQILWKKSASLESLQAVDYDRRRSEEREALKNSYVRANSVRVSRNRGCNESFRAAVDRSYEKDFPQFEELDDQPKKNARNSRLGFLGTMFRMGGGKSASTSSKGRKSLPSSQSVPNYKEPETAASRVPDSPRLPHSSSAGADFQILSTQDPQLNIPPRHFHQQPQPQRQRPRELYDHLPSAMMRPGSRVGIADPTPNPDYDVIQHTLHQHTLFQRNRMIHHHPSMVPQNQQQQHYAPLYNHPPPPPSTIQHQKVQHRSGSRSAASRPKSNFYEYETWSGHHHHLHHPSSSSYESSSSGMYSLPRSGGGHSNM